MKYETKYQKFTKEEVVVLYDALQYDMEEQNSEDDATAVQKQLLKELKTAIKYHAKLDKQLK